MNSVENDRKRADEQGMAEREALKKRIKGNSKEFVQKGAGDYAKV